MSPEPMGHESESVGSESESESSGSECQSESRKCWFKSRLESIFNRVQSSPCFCYFIIFLSYQTFPSKYMGHLAFIVRDRVTEDNHHLSPEINRTF